MTGCPMLVVGDVPRSAEWYCELLGAENAHPGEEFAMIKHEDQLVLMLHHREFDEHPTLSAPGPQPPGVGVLFYYWVNDIEQVYERALVMEADVVDEPHLNPNARSREFSLRDPDGYGVTVSAKHRESE